MKSLGKFKAKQHDPVKIYFEKSLKNLVLGNTLTGPALSNDHNLSSMLNSFFCTKVNLNKDASIKHN